MSRYRCRCRICRCGVYTIGYRGVCRLCRQSGRHKKLREKRGVAR